MPNHTTSTTRPTGPQHRATRSKRHRSPGPQHLAAAAPRQRNLGRTARLGGTALLAITAVGGVLDAAAATPASAATARPGTWGRANAPKQAPLVKLTGRQGRDVYPGSDAAPSAVRKAIVSAFPRDQWEKAFLVSWKESRWRATAANSCCYGIFQIHRIHRARAAQLGFAWNEVQTQPGPNAVVAADLLKRSGWRAWVTA